jgi:hypothetical protein
MGTRHAFWDSARADGGVVVTATTNSRTPRLCHLYFFLVLDFAQ